MKEILKELNREVGVKGSMIMTTDGLMVASELSVGLSEEVLGAVSSGAILGFRAALPGIGWTQFSRCILNSTYGKIVVVDAGSAYLIVLLDKRIKMEVTLLAIEGAAYRVGQATRVSI